MNNKKIYLDYAATTPVDKDILKKMLPYFGEKFGNASSLHSFGQEATVAIEEARKKTANFFEAKPEEIIFTSGATESNNLAIKGVVRKYYSDSRNKNRPPHIITTAFEHSCVLKTCQKLEREGLAEVSYISPQKDGVIKVSDIQKAIRKNTLLVSVMYVNNEIGTVQPIAEIGKIIKKINAAKKLKAESYKLIFHTDATQAVNYFDCNVNKLQVDLLSMSAHKIYGPKGVGALFVKEGTAILGMQDGGSQEFKKRAGTLNVTGIVGLGATIAMLKKQEVRSKKQEILKLRNYLIEKILKEVPKTKLNGSKIKRSPNNANFSFFDVEGESLLLLLDMEGLACSTGSACSSGSLSPSHVLLSIGLKPEEAHGSLRLTIGKHTTKKEIEQAIRIIKKTVEKLRKISGNLLEEYYTNSRNIQHATRNNR